MGFDLLHVRQQLLLFGLEAPNLVKELTNRIISLDLCAERGVVPLEFTNSRNEAFVLGGDLLS